MAIICPKCGAQYDVTMFEFDRTIVCECGQVVDATKPHRKPAINEKQPLSPLGGNGKKPA